MQNTIIPTVGRCVYYKSRGSADGIFPKTDRAAIITDVREHAPFSIPAAYDARLAVLNPDGLLFTDWLEQGQEGGQWDWMPFQKDQQARLAAGTPVNAPTSSGSSLDGSVTAAS